MWFLNLSLKTMMSTKTLICTSETKIQVCECVCMHVHKALHKCISVVQLLHKWLYSFLEGTEENRVQKAFKKFWKSPSPPPKKKRYVVVMFPLLPPTGKILCMQQFELSSVSCPTNGTHFATTHLYKEQNFVWKFWFQKVPVVHP
jgi:hypothetical protein